jgi:hypothetical protein
MVNNYGIILGNVHPELHKFANMGAKEVSFV